MTIPQIIIRDALYDKIKADVSQVPYTFNNVAVEKTYYPSEKLEELTKVPHIKVVGMGFGLERNRETRAILFKLSLPVQIAVQMKVEDISDLDQIDRLVILAEQAAKSGENDELVEGEDYTFERTEFLKDDNGLQYSYEDLTVKGVFQSVHTVFYSHIQQPT